MQKFYIAGLIASTLWTTEQLQSGVAYVAKKTAHGVTRSAKWIRKHARPAHDETQHNIEKTGRTK